MDVTARYQTVKQHILDRIMAGDWPPGARVPSENDLVEALGISRMTVNRAVRELAQEGHVVRLAGVGTFVVERRPDALSVPIAPIDQWITARGHRHTWRIIASSQFPARPELARLYGLGAGAMLAFALILHSENGAPIQLEERYVNLEAVPDFAAADLAVSLPDGIIEHLIPSGITHLTVEAQQPGGRAAVLLQLQPQEPCLVATKQIESANGVVASIVRLFHPGSRFRLENARSGR